ncbi:MAG TPA: hypothetical protein VI488_16320 [Candidatus Angelobacter sp.]
MAVTKTSIRLDTQVADETAKILSAKSRTEAVHTALREIVALKPFKKRINKHTGELILEGRRCAKRRRRDHRVAQGKALGKRAP